MLFHRCQSAKVTLETFRVVVMDITANHFHQFSKIRETLSIITFSLQDAPKSFHRAIVNAAANTRHTLYHASINQPLVEVSVGILKSTVTVEDSAPIPELTDRKKSRKLESKGAHVMEQKKMKNRTAPPRYDDAFKAGAVRLVTEQGRQPVEVAKELGICIDTLRSWLKASGVQMGQVSRQNREQKRIRELEAENRSLRRQLGEKDEVIDVLKKSVGILSKP